ncbi:pectinesterase family protein [Vibrio algarum]|uniref:Pectinesterase n=1 Tax=Vibrio algarum TaxID=3020714 RepID=A0ABT4YWS9_9VIBR|nr:pectinesterase family protein [Vibrio sp. KJ40-1]MDB1125935.1 pectinesterase family protein [Vibrio sp. KJ40-1]
MNITPFNSPFDDTDTATRIDQIVDINGRGDFTSIQQCIDAAPKGNKGTVIYIRKGTYREKLHITRDNITLIGEHADETIITSSTANGMLDQNGRIWATRDSRTVSIDAEYFHACNLTIKNGFDFLKNQKKSPSDPTRILNTQAVALLLSPACHHAELHNINLISYHDTLYILGNDNLFKNVMICGTVDFIFGSGSAFFHRCDIVCRFRDDIKHDEPMGFVCAPSTDINQKLGFVFYHCSLKKENPLVSKGSYGLGRPWHPTTSFPDGTYADPNAIGSAIFITCFMDDHIYGWDIMHGRNHQGRLISFYPEHARFFEYGNYGKGTLSNKKTRRQLSKRQSDSIIQLIFSQHPSFVQN